MNVETAQSVPSEQLSSAEFLGQPKQLREALTERGVLEFPTYKSGLLPASGLHGLSAEEAAHDTMHMAWLRDNGQGAVALWEAGSKQQREIGAGVGRALLQILTNNRDRIDGLLDGSISPDDIGRRIPVRVHGDTLKDEQATEQRVQHDATGYALWAISKLALGGAMRLQREDYETLAQTVRYADKLSYWHIADHGHWEEDVRIHASSIGAQAAGIVAVGELFSARRRSVAIDFDLLAKRRDLELREILAQGVTELLPNGKIPPEHHEEAPYRADINPHESIAQAFRRHNSDRRRYDASLIFLPEPLNIVSSNIARKIITDAERELVQWDGRGTIRYPKDSYWGPSFMNLVDASERTDGDEHTLAARDKTGLGNAVAGKAAQWPLFEPPLSSYWGKEYARTGDATARKLQLAHLDRTLGALTKDSFGQLRLPEAYYYDAAGQLAPNSHIPLVWTQALLVSALQVFEQTS